jgi:hypothetical protein
MKRTLTSLGIVVSPPLQPARSCTTFIVPGPPTPLNRGGISVDRPPFSSVNKTLRHVKLDGECDEAHTNVTRHEGGKPNAAARTSAAEKGGFGVSPDYGNPTRAHAEEG